MKWKIADSSELYEYKDIMYEMYKNNYKSHIGLVDLKEWNIFPNYFKCSCYLLTNNKEIYGVIIYRLVKYGNKIVLVLSSSPDIAKKYVIPKLIKLLNVSGFYAELSEALEYLVRKEGVNNIEDHKIIKILSPTVTEDDIFKKEDKRRLTYLLNEKHNIPSPTGSYLKQFTDLGIVRKALYGNPCLTKKFKDTGCKRTCKTRKKNLKVVM